MFERNDGALGDDFVLVPLAGGLFGGHDLLNVRQFAILFMIEFRGSFLWSVERIAVKCPEIARVGRVYLCLKAAGFMPLGAGLAMRTVFKVSGSGISTYFATISRISSKRDSSG